jgi:hypothetical protein
VNTIMNLHVQQQAMSFLTIKGSVSYSRTDVYGRRYLDQQDLQSVVFSPKTCKLQAKT